MEVFLNGCVLQGEPGGTRHPNTVPRPRREDGSSDGEIGESQAFQKLNCVTETVFQGCAQDSLVLA